MLKHIHALLQLQLQFSIFYFLLHFEFRLHVFVCCTVFQLLRLLCCARCSYSEWVGYGGTGAEAWEWGVLAEIAIAIAIVK